MKKMIYVFVGVLLMTACQNDSSSVDIEMKEGEKRSKLAANDENLEELKKASEQRRIEREKQEKEILSKQTTMEITPLAYDFQTIPKGEPVSTVFTVKNTGDKPLVINDAKASCGCTVPRKPEEPIMPGETGELEVTFTSKNGQEGKPVSKSITVTANIPGSTKIVTIKGNVTP